MTSMFAGDAMTRLGQDSGVRAGRHATQNSEACLVGGVVGLAQFMGPAAAATGASPAAAPAPGLGGMAGGASVAPSTPVAISLASGRGETPPEGGVPTSIIVAAPIPASARSAGDIAGDDVSAPPLSPATDHGPAATQQMGAAPASGMPAATGEAGGPAPPQQASPLPVAIAQPSHAAPEAPAQEAFPQIAAAFSGFMQANVSMSEHAATAVSKVGTHIEAIYNSIVFLGDNIAVANALNFAPLSQLNQLAGAGGGAGNFSQLSNLAVSDNDATAVAIAGTWIDYAYNSIIVVGTNTAVASATNIAPVTQVNMALFDDLDDAAFGSIHESNFLLSDNDGTALAQAGIYVGDTGGSLEPSIAPSYASDALFDEMPGYPNWSDAAET